MASDPTRIWNPPNPYTGEHRELLGEPPVAALEIYEDHSQSLLSHNDSPDLGFRWSVNPYRGCFHACAYCYARRTHEYFGLGAGTDFERKLFVKRRAPELLRAAFERPSWSGELVAMSGVTDCYQPLEAAWGLTRGCLAVCLEFCSPVAIVTKSLLVRRDVELLQALHREASISVAISIPFLDEEVVRAVEPGAPSTTRRFETIRILAEAGIPVGIGVAPVIPGLNDRDIPSLLREAKRCGAQFAFHTLLRLPGAVRDVFLHRLRERLPLAADRVAQRILDVRGGRWNDARFGFRHRGRGPYWEMIEQTWRVWMRRVGFDHEEGARRRPTFRRPVSAAPAPQLEFHW